jgi:hypothetical protein
MTNSKFIIHNKSSLSDLQAFELINNVIKLSKMLGNADCYCPTTHFNKATVCVKKLKSETFIFTVTDE